MQIDLIFVGKQEKQFSNLVELYSERIKRYTDLKIHEIEVRGVRDEKVRNRLENEKLLELMLKIRRTRFINFWACEPSAKLLTSEELASNMNDIIDRGQSIGFIVGGSIGLDHSVLEICQSKISFSKMIFPHQLFRVMLLEQIYRAYSISTGSPYHKA